MNLQETARRRAMGVLIIGLVVVMSGVAAWQTWNAFYCGPVSTSETLRTATYTGSETCFECHEAATALWRDSDHAMAMAHATPETVVGDFSDRTLTHFDVTSRMFRDSERFCIETDDADGGMRTFEIRYTLGRRPLQQYLVEFPDGRIQCLPIAWNVRDRQWFHLYPDDPVPSSDPLHWTQSSQTWNFMCADCHTTGYEKNFSMDGKMPDSTTAERGTYRSTWKELGVGCETCHGPGSIHCERANSWAGIPKGNPNYGLVELRSPKPDAQIDSCAPCHARRRQISADLSPHRPFSDRWAVELPDGELYYVDGQVLSEDFEYTSFVQCRMYHEKVQCGDCHDPHSMNVKFSDNRLCTQCHLSEKYDTEKHHFHKPTDHAVTSPADSWAATAFSGELRMRVAERADGTYCTDCHMAAAFYMVCDARPDHAIRVPRPDLTASLGVPNACNACHFDPVKGETPAWADATCEKWYGKTWSDRKRTPHFGEAFDAARRGTPDGEVQLTTLLGRADQRPVVRAAALERLAMYRGRAGLRAATDAFSGGDENVWVRLAAVRAMENYTPASLDLRADDPRTRAAASEAMDAVERVLRPRLSDPSEAVRTEAARILAVADASVWSDADRTARSRALDEYTATLHSLADQPAAHVALAILATHCGNMADAESEYLAAIALDCSCFEARMNLAALYDETGQPRKAEPLLRETVEIEERRLADSRSWYVPSEDGVDRPVGGEGRFYSIPLLENRYPLAATNGSAADMSDASTDREVLRARHGLFPFAANAPTLAASNQRLATQLNVQLAEAYYSLGLFLASNERDGIRQLDEAVTPLTEAVQRMPNDARKRYNLAVCLQMLGRHDEAATHIDELRRMAPDNPLYRQLQHRSEK